VIAPAAAGMASGVSFSERGGWWVVAQVPLLALAVVLPPWTAGSGGEFARPLQWLGLALVVGGILLFLAGLVALGRALTPFPHPREGAQLVTRGVFRIVRHPIYTGVFIGALGWALAHLSIPGVACSVLLAVFFDRKARREERLLRSRFPEYAAYERRVRRFIPGIY
jgi:protein-S-isoprenylcysteine O-methyltransferase Ste14